MESLGRMLARENTASDLLAMLIEMDPASTVRALPGTPVDVVAVRELVATSSRRGRLDLLLRDAADPGTVVAVLEMKGAADLHGDQLSRYDSWVDSQRGTPARYYCTFDGLPADVTQDAAAERWAPVRLSSLFGAWCDSSDPHAAWLARQIVTVLTAWDSQAGGIISHGRGWYVPDVITRRVARALHASLIGLDPENEARANRTSAGNPSLMSWRRDPVSGSSVWLGVDVRSQGRRDQAAPWLFRPCVDIGTPDPDDRRSDRLAVHDRAAQLTGAMGLASVRDALVDAGRSDFADALSVGSRSFDGFRRPPTPDRLAEWHALTDSERTGKRPHPVFFHDGHTRLATQFELNVSRVTALDLADMIYIVLAHLATSATAS